MKEFYAEIFVEKEKLEEAGKKYPIKLTYYKKINKEEIIRRENKVYGITIIKTEYIPNDTKIENRELPYLSNDEQSINRFLEICKRNEVTPMGVDEIIDELAKKVL